MEYRLNVEISESEVTLFVCCSAKNLLWQIYKFYAQVAVAALVLALKMKNIEVRQGSC